MGMDQVSETIRARTGLPHLSYMRIADWADQCPDFAMRTSARGKLRIRISKDSELATAYDQQIDEMAKADRKMEDVSRLELTASWAMGEWQPYVPYRGSTQIGEYRHIVSKDFGEDPIVYPTDHKPTRTEIERAEEQAVSEEGTGKRVEGREVKSELSLESVTGVKNEFAVAELGNATAVRVFRVDNLRATTVDLKSRKPYVFLIGDYH